MDDKIFDQVFGNEQSFQDYDFDKYAELDDGGLTTSNPNMDASSINVEEYAFNELDFDSKFRSIQTVNPNSFSHFSAPTLNSLAPPTLSRGPSKVNRNELLHKAPVSVVVKPTTSNIKVPELPFDVALTQFETKCDIDTVVSFIEHEFKSILELSYEFYCEACRWECVYLCGATRCKFEFNVFKGNMGSYVVEGNRLCGDNFPFNGVFRSVKSKFSGEPCSPKSVVNFQCTPMPESACELSESEINDAIMPVIAMASSGIYESQVNAAQIFCDLSLQENMHEVLCRRECVTALVDLSRVEFNSCNQHALCALANLSCSWSCQEVVREDADFLQQLLQLCRCGCHNTAEMRRECARMLANLCSSKPCAIKILQTLGENTICRWMDTVDGLSDERLRLHAQRAKDALSTCLV